MQTEKNYEILADLLVLRAGLSIISEKKDCIDKIIDNNISKCTALVTPRKKAVERCNDKVSHIEGSKDSNRLDINFAKAQLKVSGSSKKIHFKLILNKTAYVLMILGIILSLLAALWVICIMPMEWGWFGTSYPEVLDKVPFNFLYKTFEVKLDENGWVGAIPFGVFAVATGLFIYCVLSISDKQSDVKEISDKHKEAKSNERLIKRLNTNIPNLEHNINEAKKELIEEQNKLNNIKVTVKQMTKEANNNANKIAADGNVIYKALVKTFSSLLDERDWQNLDYIIFSFETGRALTIKDALFYVDRERETERIVASIQEANRNLSKVIRAEVGSLKSAMERSFYELNENLRACTKSINENITNTGGSIVNSINQANMITQANIQSLRGEMQNIAYNSEKLNAALINNINKPSNILIDDVHAIRRRINC